MTTPPSGSHQFRKQYFVRSDGSDDNDGSQDHPSAAFRTIQRAVDAASVVTASPASAVNIHVAHGSYEGGILISGSIPAKPDKDGFMIRLVGDEEHPSEVEIEGVGVDAVRCSDGASILIAGVTLRTREAGNLLTAKRRGSIAHRNCVFQAAASETIAAHRFAEVYALGPTTVLGGSSAFVHATSRSLVSFYRQTITFGEAVHFSTYLWGVKDATVSLDKARIIGRATGDIAVHINAVLNVVATEGEWRGGTEPRVLDGGVIATDIPPSSFGRDGIAHRLFQKLVLMTNRMVRRSPRHG